MSTFFPKKEEIQREWYLVDATDLPIGRLSSFVAKLLMGKENPKYTPHLDMGDNVIVINADKVRFTGKKAQQKLYRRHSTKPGSLKEIPAEKMLEKHPTRPVELAVRGMLPKTKLGRAMYRKLHVYAGEAHKHQAQKPEQIEMKA